jgi:cyclopropane fatty-acyl-phospholipid synthase-like methyltransferase
MVDMPRENIWDKGRWKGVTEVTLDFMTRYIFEHMLVCVDPKGKRVLELGAGTGRLSYLFLQAGARKVTMLDSSEKALALAKGLFKNTAPDRYDIVFSDVFDYASDESFDIVFSSGLIEHFQGDNRRRILEAHLASCARDCLILHPSNRLYNRIFDRTRMARRRYGVAQTYPDAELAAYFADMPRVEQIRHQRFHFFYTVPLFHNLETINRWCGKTFLGKDWGGLCLTHITLK